MTPEFWWHVTRASGLMAWAFLTFTMLWGLALSTRLLGSRPGPRFLLSGHRWVAGLGVGFTLLHVVAIIADSFEHFTLAEVLVPMASDWNPGAVAWGVVAFWLVLAIQGTSLAIRRLPRALWHAVHLLSIVLFASSSLHLVQAGTDAQNPLVIGAVVLSVMAICFFSLYGFITRRIPLGPEERNQRIQALVSS